MGSFIRRFGPLLLKAGILALVVWGGHRTIAGGIAELRQNEWQIDQLRPTWAVLAGILYLISQFPCAWFWHSVLSALGQSVAWPRAIGAHYIGHLGKYVPGKAMVVVLRAGLIGGSHIKTSLAVIAVFYETFVTMAVGTVIAVAILLFTNHEHTWLILTSLGLALLVGLPTLPLVFDRLLKLLRRLRAAPQDSFNASQLSVGLILRGWLMIGIGWFFAGASLWATMRAIGVESTSLSGDLPIYTATVALSVAWGFVSMLPAGLGVREIVLLQLLAPHLEQIAPTQGERLALIAVIVLRLTWLAAEVVLAAVLYPLIKRAKPIATE
jgi:hypothetical protein